MALTLHVAYLGLTQRNGCPVTGEMRNAVLANTARLFGGYTASDANGGYTMDSGEIITEPSLRIEVLTDAPMDTIRTWAESISHVCNQESVLLYTFGSMCAEFIRSNAHENQTTAV